MKYAQEYSNKTGMPSVNDVIKSAGLSPSFQGIPNTYAEKGSEVHALIDMDINGRLMPSVDTMKAEGYYGYLQGARKFMADYRVQVIATEERLTHDALGFCGQVDLFCKVFGAYNAVVDWKTGNWYDYYALTMAGYVILAQNKYGHDHIIRLPVLLSSKQCDACGGEGIQQGHNSVDYYTDPCPTCKGDGAIWGYKVKDCENPNDLAKFLWALKGGE